VHGLEVASILRGFGTLPAGPSGIPACIRTPAATATDPGPANPAVLQGIRSCEVDASIFSAVPLAVAGTVPSASVQMAIPQGCRSPRSSGNDPEAPGGGMRQVFLSGTGRQYMNDPPRSQGMNLIEAATLQRTASAAVAASRIQKRAGDPPFLQCSPGAKGLDSHGACLAAATGFAAAIFEVRARIRQCRRTIPIFGSAAKNPSAVQRHPKCGDTSASTALIAVVTGSNQPELSDASTPWGCASAIRAAAGDAFCYRAGRSIRSKAKRGRGSMTLAAPNENRQRSAECGRKR